MYSEKIIQFGEGGFLRGFVDWMLQIVNEKTEPQLLPEEHVVLKTLGEVPYERETSFIIDGNSNSKSLTIGECYVTPGNWAGFPPHKHDEDNMPVECIAEEIYYFLYYY